MHLTLSKDDRNHVLIGNTAAREKEEQKKRDERLSGSCHSISLTSKGDNGTFVKIDQILKCHLF